MKTKKKQPFLRADGTKGQGGQRKWHPTVILDIYRHARAGLGDIKMAKVMKLTYTTFKDWRRKHPEVKEALERGRRDWVIDQKKAEELDRRHQEELHKATSPDGTNKNDIRDFVFSRLPPNLQAIWERIDQAAETGAYDGMGDEDSRLEVKRLKRFSQQHLLLYAIVNSEYNVSEALRKCGIKRSTFDLWCRNPDFQELLRQVNEHKADFFETQFIALVRAGDPKAIIHANKTYNRGRGYGNEVKVSVSGTVDHQHTHKMTKITDLDLPLETRIKIRDSYRDKLAEHKEQKETLMLAAKAERRQAEEDESIEDAEVVEPSDVDD